MDPSASSANQGKKPLSAVNARPNPNDRKRKRDEAAARGKAGAYGGQRGAASKPSEVAARKKSRQESAEVKYKEMLKNFVNDRRGSSYPNGPLAKTDNKNRDVMLVIEPIAGTEATLVEGLKQKFGTEPMIPHLSLKKAGYEAIVRSNNVAPFAGSRLARAGSDKVLQECELPVNAPNLVICKAFASQCGIGHLSEVDAAKIVKFGRNRDGSGATINCLSFVTKGIMFEKKPQKEDLSSEMEVLVKQLNLRPHMVTMIRRKLDVGPLIDQYWQHKMKVAFERGVWHNYNKEIGIIEGELFKEWIEKPLKPLSVPKWLEYHRQDKLNMGDTSNVRKYASNIAKKCVGSARELEIMQSVALIGEVMHETAVVQSYFTNRVVHQARVISVNQGWVEAEVTVTQSKDYQMPKVTTKTKFEIRPVQPRSVMVKEQDVGMDEDVLYRPDAPADKGKQPEIDYEIDSPLFKNAKVIDKDALNGDFVIGFMCKDNNDLAKHFSDGQDVRLVMTMKRNFLPFKRMLKAIGSICRRPRDLPAKFMQEFLLGLGNPDYKKYQKKDGIYESLKDDFFSRMSDEEKDTFNKFAESCSFNDRQQKFVDHIFGTREFVTLLQGPPGTGKTHTLSGTGVLAAVARIKVAICAPSNIAVGQNMTQIVKRLKNLYAINPAAKDWFKVVYLPTEAATRADLDNLQYGDAFDATAHEMVSGITYDDLKEDEFQEFRLWSHIRRSIRQRLNVRDGSAEELLDCQKWLDILKTMTACEWVERDEKRWFVEYGINETEKVLRDPTVRIVLTTCNNADQLVSCDYNPLLVIIDESAFATEQDCYIPLSLRGRIHILAGDHEQLRPVVLSKGHNVMANQLRMSIFERHYGHPSVSLHRLKRNYRMHPVISDLPGQISYEYLECDESTLVEGDAYKFLYDWAFNGDGQTYLGKIRDPKWGGKWDGSLRRIFINVKGGRSAPKVGDTSLRNFANVNAVCEFLYSLYLHQSTDSTIPDLPGSAVTILTPYKAQAKELKQQVRWLFKSIDPHFKNIPAVSTAHGFQGSEAPIIVLELTPANEHHGSLIGFLAEWNRINVALTRAKEALWIVGNLDAWMSELKVIVKGFKCKKFALFLIDLLDKDHVIDVESQHYLPANEEEALGPDSSNWTKLMEEMPVEASQLPKRCVELARTYIGEERDRYERELLTELQKSRATANDKLNLAAAGRDDDLPLIVRREDEAPEDSFVEFRAGSDENESESESGMDFDFDIDIPEPTTHEEEEAQLNVALQDSIVTDDLDDVEEALQCSRIGSVQPSSHAPGAGGSSSSVPEPSAAEAAKIARARREVLQVPELVPEENAEEDSDEPMDGKGKAPAKKKAKTGDKTGPGRALSKKDKEAAENEKKKKKREKRERQKQKKGEQAEEGEARNAIDT
jgi:hypothetical protein